MIRCHHFAVFATVLLLGWVVWIQASKRDLDLKLPRTTDWETTGKIYSTLEECESASAIQADAFEFILKKRDPEAKRHGMGFVSHDDAYLYSHEFVCLADTVDPRGPKGDR